MRHAAPVPATADSVLWRRLLTLEERKALLAIDPWRSAWTVGVNWVLVFAAMALVRAGRIPLTIVVALFVIGARQLGMAVVMHEAAHRTLFKQRRLNDWVGNWLAAYPVWAEVGPYRDYHLMHHAHTGTDRGSRSRPRGAVPDHARELPPQGVARSLAGRPASKQASAVLQARPRSRRRRATNATSA